MALSNQQILEKAIQKAIDGGWDEILDTETWKVTTDRGLEVDIEMRSPYTGNLIGERKDYMEIIFNHDFARALWGEKPCNIRYKVDLLISSAEDIAPSKMWQYHLQNMVIASDPIKYLGDNL